MRDSTHPSKRMRVSTPPLKSCFPYSQLRKLHMYPEGGVRAKRSASAPHSAIPFVEAERVIMSDLLWLCAWSIAASLKEMFAAVFDLVDVVIVERRVPNAPCEPVEARAAKVQIVDHFTTRVKTSSKSIPQCCSYPLATRRAFSGWICKVVMVVIDEGCWFNIWKKLMESLVCCLKADCLGRMEIRVD